MYKAIIDLRVEVQECKENICSGNIIPEKEMNNYGLKNNMLICIEGQTKNDCLTKLKKWVKDAN